MTGKILSDVNKAVLKAFMKKAVGDELTKKEAEKLGVEKEYLDLADDLDVEDIHKDNKVKEVKICCYVCSRTR